MVTDRTDKSGGKAFLRLKTQLRNVSSLASKEEKDDDEDRPTTCLDIQQILPTVIIIIITLVIMGTVIPYAFHVVIQELKDYYGDDEGESQILFSYSNQNCI